MASQKQLGGTRVTRKGDSNTKVLAPTFAMVAARGQRLTGQPLHPIKHALQIFKDASKEEWGAHLNECTARGTWSLPESNLHINYLELKAVFLARLLLRQDNTCSNRQHHSGVIHKQGRRHEAGPTLCSTVENLDLVDQKSSNSQSPIHSRPAECGRRQAIQARPDHPNRVVSPSGGLPSNMQQVAPASNRFICHEVQQQVASFCVSCTGSPGHSS